MFIVLLCVYCCLYTVVAGLLARRQYPEDPATGHFGTGFSWFPSGYKRMLRWFTRGEGLSEVWHNRYRREWSTTHHATPSV